MDIHVTRNGSVFVQLREEIVLGQFKPGERLRIEALRQRYDVGGSPVREALMRLEAEGLVELEENKGFRVAQVSREELQDLTDTRLEIEGIALRKSIELGGVDWEAKIISSMHLLASASKAPIGEAFERNSEWLKFHREFHQALLSGCQSPMVLDIQLRLFDLAERYVALSISTTKGESRDHESEHRALMEAALARNVDLALRLNREHIERTTEKLMRFVDFG